MDPRAVVLAVRAKYDEFKQRSVSFLKIFNVL